MVDVTIDVLEACPQALLWQAFWPGIAARRLRLPEGKNLQPNRTRQFCGLFRGCNYGSMAGRRTIFKVLCKTCKKRLAKALASG